MRQTRNALLATLASLALAGGCSGESSSGRVTTTTSPAVATTTAGATSATSSPDVVKAALLTTADVPGSQIGLSAQQNFDFSTCFPDSPFATRADPTEVKYPGLQLTEGTVNRQYGSKFRQGTPLQAKAFVTAVASPAGSACMVDAFKRSVNEETSTPKIDASALSGTGSSVAVADGGGLLSVSGQLKVGTDALFTEADLLVFQKGGVVVYVSASGIGGPKVPGQAVELAQKIAGRLP